MNLSWEETGDINFKIEYRGNPKPMQKTLLCATRTRQASKTIVLFAYPT